MFDRSPRQPERHDDSVRIPTPGGPLELPLALAMVLAGGLIALIGVVVGKSRDPLGQVTDAIRRPRVVEVPNHRRPLAHAHHDGAQPPETFVEDDWFVEEG